VIQTGVQQLVGEHKQTFRLVQTRRRVDPDRPATHIDGRHPNSVQLAHARVFLQIEADRQRA